jgi:hypothetical protein
MEVKRELERQPTDSEMLGDDEIVEECNFEVPGSKGPKQRNRHIVISKHSDGMSPAKVSEDGGGYQHDLRSYAGGTPHHGSECTPAHLSECTPARDSEGTSAPGSVPESEE